MRRHPGLLLTILIAACGSTKKPRFVTIEDLAVVAPSDAGDPNPDPPPIDPGPAEQPCSEQAKLVYVVDENNKLSSFKPDKLQFVDIGTLRCPAEPGATPFSMAVDRMATAWVVYSSGELFRVDTKTAGCKATAFAPDQLGFSTFGMGFASNAMGSAEETLFISGAGGLGDNSLGAIDLKAFKVRALGRLAGSPELTGTGDAKLWGFFPDNFMPRIAQLDKASGKELKKLPLDAIAGSPSAWAFAFWGGDFWIFLKRGGDPSTQVHRVTQAGKLTTPLPNTGRSIVGAGVSTCAPTTPIG